MKDKRLPSSLRPPIARSAGSLRGNGKVAVLFEPLFGIPYVLFSFYMSLYMKSQGVTNDQLGYITAVGFVSGAVFSLLAGPIVDRLGRKKSTLLFDLAGWVPALLIWMVAGNFMMFAAAALINSGVRVAMVSGMCMVVEDSTDEERLAVFNFKYILNLAVGVLTPLAGVVIGHWGLVTGQRLLLAFAVVCFIAMDLTRNHFYRETEVGLRLMERHGTRKNLSGREVLGKPLAALRRNPSVLPVLLVSVAFNMFLVMSPFSSVYFAPYLTEVLGFDKSAASVFGSVISFGMFLVFVFLVPALPKGNSKKYLLAGLAIQAVSLLAFAFVPAGNFPAAIPVTAVYAFGNSMTRPFLDAVMADAIEGEDRAGLYSFCNMVSGLVCAAASSVSGSLYNSAPIALILVSLASLTAAGLLLAYHSRKPAAIHHHTFIKE